MYFLAIFLHKYYMKFLYPIRKENMIYCNTNILNGPELQNIRLNHFRVDRISGADNDRHKTERVRVNNEPKTQRDVYGSRINQ